MAGGSDLFVLKHYVVSAYGTNSRMAIWLSHRKFFENQALDHYDLDPQWAWGGPLRDVASGNFPRIRLIDLDTNRCGTYTWSVSHGLRVTSGRVRRPFLTGE